jgi:hypothetical protein
VNQWPFYPQASLLEKWSLRQATSTPMAAPPLTETPRHALTSSSSLFYKSHAYPTVRAAPSFPGQPGSSSLSLNLALGGETFLLSFLCQRSVFLTFWCQDLDWVYLGTDSALPFSCFLVLSPLPLLSSGGSRPTTATRQTLRDLWFLPVGSYRPAVLPGGGGSYFLAQLILSSA